MTKHPEQSRAADVQAGNFQTRLQFPMSTCQSRAYSKPHDPGQNAAGSKSQNDLKFAD